MVLAELAKPDQKHTAASNRARFLSMKDDIHQLIVNEGIPILSIWRVLTEKKYIAYSYETFNRYCKIYILSKQTSKQIGNHQPKEILAAKIHKSIATEIDSEPIKAGNRNAGTFQFNNSPNTEDLL